MIFIFFLRSSRLQVSRTSSTLKWSSWSWAMPGPSSRTKDPKPCSERAQRASARCSLPPTGSLRHCALSLSTHRHTATDSTHTHHGSEREADQSQEENRPPSVWGTDRSLPELPHALPSETCSVGFLLLQKGTMLASFWHL